jgi:diguanylate cyclase (GGDEF)-like protein
MPRGHDIPSILEAHKTMNARADRFDPLDLYVTAIILIGGACAAGLVISAGDYRLLWTPEIVIFAFFALVGEFVPLKVFTRGAEGEVTTSTCFAVALLLVGGPLAAFIGLATANIIADGLRRKAVKKVAFNVAQYAITIAASGAVLELTTGLPRVTAPHLIPADLIGILLAAGTFFVCNTALVATVIAFVQRAGVFKYLAQDLFFQASTAGLLLGLAPVVVLAADFSLPAIALLFLPLFAVHRGGREAIAKEHQALHDALTGLPNRELFRDRIEHAIRSSSRRAGEASVVMIMDLDHFKEINDTLGHHYGDLLLQEVARRLQQALRDSDTVARLGGDEFGVLLPSVAKQQDATVMAQQLLMHLREPFVLDGMRLEIDASIGIALHPTHGEDVETLNQRADIAMYSAKQAGRGYAIFEPELDRHSPRRLALAGGLRSAIIQGEIQLYYQPKADLRDGRIVGVEALARWDHPEFGIIGPSEFVPIAEQTGLITPLTSFVLDAALRQIREWKDSGLELSVAVNLSARSFLDTQLAVEIPRLLARWDVEAELLELEITESMLMTDPARAEATLERLSQIGLTLSVDDFGTGYSSLANLKRLPVDVIKIDKSFVMEMAVDASDAAIVRSTIELAHNLGLRVVAEGVESEDAWRQLEALGCDYAQGYYLSRPLPADAATRLIRERGATRAVAPPTLRVVQGLGA